MKSRFLLVLCPVLFSVSAVAQNADRIEVFGGYSRTGYAIYGLYSGPWRTEGFNGWEASGAFRLLPHLAAEADFSGGDSPTFPYKLQTYMGGPHVSATIGRFGVFGHFLVGGLHLEGTTAPPATSFVYAFGGGADAWFTRYIGVRLVQIDYLRNANAAAAQALASASSGGHNDYRISTGVVVRF